MDNAVNIGHTATIVSAVFQAVATVFVGARLFCRIKLLDKLYIDDWIILISLLCGWLAFAFSEEAVKYGLGRHWETLTRDQKSQILLLTTLCEFFPGILALTLPKLAVINLYCRMLNPSRFQKYIMWGGGALVSINALICLGTYMIRCTPFQANYDLSITNSYCRWGLDFQVILGIYTTVACAVLDLYLAVYPACVLSRLRMSARKKIALSVALGIGSVSVGIAAYKATRMKAINSPDYSYDGADLEIWLLVEGAVVIIAACIPLLKPLVDMALGAAFLGSTYKNSDHPDSSTSEKQDLVVKRSKPTLTNLIEMAAGSSNDSKDTILPVIRSSALRIPDIERGTDINVYYQSSDLETSLGDNHQSGYEIKRSQIQ